VISVGYVKEYPEYEKISSAVATPSWCRLTIGGVSNASFTQMKSAWISAHNVTFQFPIKGDNPILTEQRNNGTNFYFEGVNYWEGGH
jgi:hypothetical protein